MSEKKRTGYIYQIVNMTNNKKYVGSTFQGIRKRWWEHKQALKSKKEKHRDLYVDMKKLGFSAFRCELLKEVQVKNKQELHQIEGEFIRKLDTFQNGYNNCIAGRSSQEYYKDNIDKIKATQKKYSENTEFKKKMREYQKQYHSSIKGKLSRKKYSQSAKGLKARERMREVITCECGSSLTRLALSRHKKTKKHIQYISKKEIQS